MFARLKRDFGRTVDRFANVRLRDALATYGRALRLQAGFGAGYPDNRKQDRPRRIVVAMSTIPARARHIGPAIASLLDQSEPADRLILAYPRTSRRDGAAYPDPATLGLPEQVDILRCEDEGPATKLLPALGAEPDALIVVVDDDVVYPRDFLQTLLAAHLRHPEAACAYRGVRLDRSVEFADLPHVLATGIRQDEKVDIIFGTWGYLLPARLLDPGIFDFSGYPEAVRWVDDVWISGQLARIGVERLVVTAKRFPVETIAALKQSLTSGINRSGANDATAIEAFRDDW